MKNSKLPDLPFGMAPQLAKMLRQGADTAAQIGAATKPLAARANDKPARQELKNQAAPDSWPAVFQAQFQPASGRAGAGPLSPVPQPDCDAT
jgi:hypothetical protein